MPKAIKGDHSILSQPQTAHPDTPSRARTTTSTSTSTLPLRKTPSPKPPSPTNNGGGFSSGRGGKGTPSPPPPPMLSSRSSLIEHKRRSPSAAADRHSPTQPGKGSLASSPTESSLTPLRPTLSKHARSLSTSTTPTPPAGSAGPHSSPRASLGPRSKSQAEGPAPSRVGSEARRPTPRRPETTVETRDSCTQTEGDELGDVWGDPTDEMEPDVVEEEPLDSEEPLGSGSFLSGAVRIQAELEMALRSQMEMIAEGSPTATLVPGPPEVCKSKSAGPAISGPMPPQGMRPIGGRRQLRPLGRGGKPVDRDNDNSDGENHPEDDEVKSLSLSEDGPVIRRSFSEGAGGNSVFFGRDHRHAVAAPDPIAMLTDGTRKAMLSARSVIGATVVGEAALGRASGSGSARSPPDVGSPHQRNSATDADGPMADLSDALASSMTMRVDDEPADISADGEPLGSDRSIPNESDQSTAPTHRDDKAPAADSALLKNLIPILSKVTGHGTEGAAQLEVVQEAPGQRAGPRRVRSQPRRAQPAGSGASIKALDLSQIRLPGAATEGDACSGGGGGGGGGSGGRTFNDARSDVSFGSAQSAFTCWSSSSPSSSHLNSPRPQQLKSTVSMPALPPKQR